MSNYEGPQNPGSRIGITKRPESGTGRRSQCLDVPSHRRQALQRGTMSSNELTLLDTRITARHQTVAPEMSESEFFDLYVAEQVLKPFQVNIDALMRGLVDGDGDCGIDGFYCFINDQPLVPDLPFSTLSRNPKIDCVITQCKTSSGFSEQAIEKLAFHLPKLLSFDRDEAILAQHVNSKLLNVTADFLHCCHQTAALNPQMIFHVIYATRAEDLHPNTKKKSDEITSLIRRQLFPGARAEFSFLGAKELLESAQKSAQTNLSLAFTEGPLTSESDQGEGYVCLVRIDEYYRFVTNESDETLNVMLFESNVRDHEGKTDVNISINKTLENQKSEDFWWLNNGVTIVSPTVNQMGKRLHLTDPQIVNGLQTSTEIYNYFHGHPDAAGDRHILVRVVVPRDGLARDRIIRATNNQNRLPGSALRATDRIQHSIEEYFGARGFHYDRRKNYYSNQGRPLDRIVSMESLAQSVAACYLREPWVSRSRSASILDDDLYERMFANSHPLNMYLNVILLTRRVKQGLLNHPQISSAEIDDWLYHISMIAAMLLTKKARPSVRDLANTDLHNFDVDRIVDIVPVVAREYEKKIRSGDKYVPFASIASNRDVSNALVKRAESMLLSSRWRKWPGEAMEEDAAILASDVFYRGPRK